MEYIHVKKKQPTAATTPEADNRRIHDRIRTHIHVCKLQSDSSAVFDLPQSEKPLILNLSRGGIYIVCNPLQIDHIVNLEFTLPKFRSSLLISGKVIWSSVIKDPQVGHFSGGMGIKFDQLNTKIERHLNLFINEAGQDKSEKDNHLDFSEHEIDGFLAQNLK